MIRQVIKEEKRVASAPKRAKNCSYLGENIPKVENIILRNLRADRLYEKLLTDITELALPNVKLYLSAMVDCFDGMVVGWTIVSRPDTYLVNTCWMW